MPGILEASVSLSHNLCWFLQPVVRGTSLPGMEPWAGELGVGLGPLSPHGVTSKAEVYLLIFIYNTWVWDQSILHLCLSYQSCLGFCISLVIELLFS